MIAPAEPWITLADTLLQREALICRLAEGRPPRDFAGLAALSLASIYLQKAHGLDAARTGFITGSMMLVSILANPLAVYISPGRRRLPMLAQLVGRDGVPLGEDAREAAIEAALGN